MGSNRIVFRTHAIQRMFERQISEKDVHGILMDGEVIENYPDDLPYPSCLMLGWVMSRPLHVVLAENIEGKERIIITVYEPSPIQWESDFKRRRTS